MNDYKTLEAVLHYLNTAEKKQLIIDSDTDNEIDDQYAIAYALLANNIDVLAINAAPFSSQYTPNPADGMELSYKEIQQVVKCIDPEGTHNIRTCRGSKTYLPNCTTPVFSEAAETIIELAHKAAEPLFVACIGCFTNVASAILIDPSIIDKIVVIALGGNKIEYRDANDYNLTQDIPAAKVLFECGVRLIVAPAMGGTEVLKTTTAEVDYYLHDHAGEIGKLLIDRYFRDEDPAIRENGVCNSRTRIIWDIGAIAIMRRPVVYCQADIIPAYTVDNNGFWCELKNGQSMIYVELFNRDEIFCDMFNILRLHDGKMV